MEQKIKVVLTGSLIGAKPNQKATAASLGLKKIGDYSIGQNTPALLGQVSIVTLSPGLAISTSAGRLMIPVTSVVLM